MKKRIYLVVLLAFLACTKAAYATTIFTGQVVSNEIQVIQAPYGGIVENLSVMNGESISIGDPIAIIETSKTYALSDGVVSGVFANEGDSVEGIEERYGALIYIEPINRYTLTCSTDKAYNSSENKYIHIGEIVYLSCTKDGSHQGQGIVTAIDEEEESEYTVEITGGEFYMGETVNVFRDREYESSSRIGRGTVCRTDTIAVKGEGSLLRMHVQAGERVERGQLLFETVEGDLDGLFAPDKQVVSPLQGMIASVDVTNGDKVEKHSKLVSVYPTDSMQIKIEISEEELLDVQVGNDVIIEFNWNRQAGKILHGEVDSISYVNQENEESGGNSNLATYNAYISFEPDENVRLGMTVTVQVV